MYFERDFNNEEEDELFRLRTAALKSMHNKNNKSDDNSNNSSNYKSNQLNDNSEQSKRTNVGNYYTRNSSKRSNLIVLTSNDSDCVHNNSPNHKTETLFTKIKQKSTIDNTGLKSKQKRVLPGRFSRLERDDTTDEDSDDLSDDNSDANNLVDSNDNNMSAFNGHLTGTESENCSIDLISDTDGMNDETKTSISNNCIEFVNIDNNNADIDKSVYCASTSIISNNNYTKLDSRNDKIKLNINTNKISGLDALERRKQKFGDSVTDDKSPELDDNSQSPDRSVNNYINSNINKSSVKSRLSSRSTHRDRKLISRHRNDRLTDRLISYSCGQNSRMTNVLTDSEQDFDDSDHSAKKKMRSLVVIKTD